LLTREKAVPMTDSTTRAATAPCRASVSTPQRQPIDVDAGEPFGPAPDGADLEFDIECRLEPRAVRGERHPVIIHRDWSITTPHDIAAERTAMAFGAYTSCVPLVEVTVNALRAATPALMRRQEVAPRRFGKTMWRLPRSVQVAECCENRSFRGLAEATAHAHHVSHLTRLWDAPLWQVRETVAIAAARWESWNRLRARESGADLRVREEGGVDELWNLGIAADDITRLAQIVSVIDDPLPVAYFVGAHYGPADPEWIKTVVEGRPDPDFATWLVSLDAPASRSDPRRWRAWLTFGLPRAHVRFAAEFAGQPETISDITTATGWPTELAARTWLRWVRVGCSPEPEHFAILAARGVGEVVPPSVAIDRLVGVVGGSSVVDAPVTSERRTELAVMLALLGTVPEVAFEVRRGSTTPQALDAADGRFFAPHRELPEPSTTTRTRNRPDTK
jgi:hypothetical protein